MNVEIIDKKHVHGKNLRDYSRNQRGEKRTTFLDIENKYEVYRQTIDNVTELNHTGIRTIVAALNEYRAFALPYLTR